MSQPLYFLPNLRKEQCDSVAQMRNILAERGLTEIFADVGHDEITVSELTGRGPEDKSGVILAYQRPDGQVPRRIGYYPVEQAWEAVSDGLYLGVDTAEPPKADDLARKTQYGGRWLTTPSGDWLIPVIRRPDDSTQLPTLWKLDSLGRDTKPIKPAYQAYWNDAAEVLDWFISDDPPPESQGVKALLLCIRALSINYRFGRNEQNLIGVIDSENFATILALTVDYPRFSELQMAIEQKKTALRERSLGAGQGDFSLTTDQRALSC